MCLHKRENPVALVRLVSDKGVVSYVPMSEFHTTTQHGIAASRRKLGWVRPKVKTVAAACAA